LASLPLVCLLLSLEPTMPPPDSTLRAKTHHGLIDSQRSLTCSLLQACVSIAIHWTLTFPRRQLQLKITANLSTAAPPLTALTRWHWTVLIASILATHSRRINTTVHKATTFPLQTLSVNSIVNVCFRVLAPRPKPIVTTTVFRTLAQHHEGAVATLRTKDLEELPIISTSPSTSIIPLPVRLNTTSTCIDFDDPVKRRPVRLALLGAAYAHA
jgi:hypothetical protein